jgi:N-acetylmuramoyl-L-alanine amidase
MNLRQSTDWIIVHTSATYPNMDIGVFEIDRWHRELGWSGCGYHYVIRRNGKVEYGRDRHEWGAHTKGFNSISVSICMVGGLNEAGRSVNNYTAEQFQTLKELVTELSVIYKDAKVVGHRDMPYVKKDCPCFSVIPWWEHEKPGPVRMFVRKLFNRRKP